MTEAEAAKEEAREYLHWMADHRQITTRDQWADILGYKKRTIDNWYSDEVIPPPALQHLKRIRTSTDIPSPITDLLRFSLSEWNKIDTARRQLGYSDTPDGRAKFFTDILTNYAATLAPVTPIRYTPEEIASSRLNEDSPETEPIRKRPA